MFVLSTHFLRRRAQAKIDTIHRRRWLSPVVIIDGHSIGLDDRLVIRKRGRWDARYDVVVIPR